LGEAGYRAFQRAGYAALKWKYGEAWATACRAKAHEVRRQWRSANPTPGEAAVALALADAGYHVHADPDRPWVWPTDAASGDVGLAIREARIGPYDADILIPAYAVVLEIVGGVHGLTVARDAARQVWIEAQGVRVVTIDEAVATTPTALAAILNEILGGGDSTPADSPLMKRWRRMSMIDITNYEVWNERITKPWAGWGWVSFGDPARCYLNWAGRL
jgi:hypothetical protein